MTLSLEQITKLRPIGFYGRRVQDVLPELNQAIEAAGIEVGEYGFSTTLIMNKPELAFSDFRWLECSAVRGSNEGYYIHIRMVPYGTSNGQPPESILVSMAKTWTWESALEICAATTRLLSDY